MSTSSRGFVHGPGNVGLIKLVCDTDNALLVGATTTGPAGGEALAELVIRRTPLPSLHP